MLNTLLLLPVVVVGITVAAEVRVASDRHLDFP
jgi:hypothetical protein